MKTLLKITTLSLLTMPLFAQQDYKYQFQFLDQDALRLTMPSLQGNARFVSMGGAFGALGGNFSALSTNPASIGIYRRSEFSFSPALTIGQTNVTPENARMRETDPRWNFNMGNFGYVAAWDISKSESKNEWKMVQFGFGLNRQADFWNRSSYTRYAPAGTTYLDALTNNANRILWSHREDILYGLGDYELMAYNSWLINHDTVADSFWNMLEHDPTKGLKQTNSTRTSGAINEWVFSFGGSYGDFLYLGATLGIPVVNLKQEKFLRETAEFGEHVGTFYEWTMQENLKVSGTGLNLKIGAIVRPTDFMRIGLALHTPTRYSLKEDFTVVMVNENLPNNFANRDRRQEKPTTYEYSIRTPMKVIGSLGFIIDKKALISMEYEMINYSKMKINDERLAFDEDNEFIQDNYHTGGVLRIGTEYRLDNMSFRGGYNYTLEPYSDNSKRKFSGHTLSAGVGFQLGTATIDLAYVRALKNYNMSPYPGMGSVTGVINDFHNRNNSVQQQFMATFGWRF